MNRPHPPVGKGYPPQEYDKDRYDSEEEARAEAEREHKIQLANAIRDEVLSNADPDTPNEVIHGRVRERIIDEGLGEVFDDE